MDGNKPVSPEVLQTDLALELEHVKHDLQSAESKIMQLELALLNSRDFAIGASAEAGQTPIVRQMYIESQRQLIDATTHIANHIDHIRRLEEHVRDLSSLHPVNRDLQTQLEKLRSSPTWIIGRIIMTPIRMLKRLVR